MRSSPWLPALCLTLLTAGTAASAQQPDAAVPTVAPTSDVPAAAPAARSERPPLGDAGSANAPSVHLRYGDLDLDLQCSTRDDAKACADAAVAIVDHLDVQRDDSGGGSGDGPDKGGGSEDRGDDRGGDDN